jgi:hypothetical protein
MKNEYSINGIKCKLNLNLTLKQVRDLDGLKAGVMDYLDAEKFLQIVLLPEKEIDVLDVTEDTLTQIAMDYYSAKKKKIGNIQNEFMKLMKENDSSNQKSVSTLKEDMNI